MHAILIALVPPLGALRTQPAVRSKPPVELRVARRADADRLPDPAGGWHAQRGQAVVETVIFLPMFLIALFGMIWAVQEAVQYERVESAVRYAGLVSQQANPYADYSLYSMYGQLGSQLIPTVPCNLPLTTPLSDAAPTYYSTQTATASTPFWSPSTVQLPRPSCTTSGIVGIQAGTGLQQDMLLSEQNPGVTSFVDVPAQLTAAFGSIAQSQQQANEFFFKPVGENTILACYPTLNTQTTSSLQYTTDISLATVPVALSSVVTPITPVVASSCTSFN